MITPQDQAICTSAETGLRVVVTAVIARPPGRHADIGHSEVNGRPAGGANGLQLLGCSGHGDLGPGDFAQSALFLRLLKPGGEVVWMSSSRVFWAGSPRSSGHLTHAFSCALGVP
jgi:hypothetical protein